MQVVERPHNATDHPRQTQNAGTLHVVHNAFRSPSSGGLRPFQLQGKLINCTQSISRFFPWISAISH